MSARLVVTPNDLCVCVRAWVKVCFGLGEFTCRCAHVCVCMCVKSSVNRRFYHAPASDPLRPWRLCCSEPCCRVWVCGAYVPALALAAVSAPWEDCWRVSKATLIPLSHLSHLLFRFLSLCTWRVLVLEETSAPSHIFTSASGCLLISWLQAILIILDKQNTHTQVNIQMHCKKWGASRT